MTKSYIADLARANLALLGVIHLCVDAHRKGYERGSRGPAEAAVQPDWSE